ncbi:receptor activity-modifying protein 1-like [Spinachia spinachia]
MAAHHVTLLRTCFMLLLAVLQSVSGCNGGFYERMINDLCSPKFKLDMAGLDRGLWCSWPDTSKIYTGLSNCTYQVALRMDCFWPNHMVDRFFMQIHRDYFRECALTGRLLHEPPTSVLAPFIAVPVLVTLLMTALVVWRSKRTQGVL